MKVITVLWKYDNISFWNILFDGVSAEYNRDDISFAFPVAN